MLTRVKRHAIRSSKRTFAIVASRYNQQYVDAMVGAAQEVFRRAGGKVQIVRVPGAFEIPVAVARLARKATAGKQKIAAIICLGVILRGETVHAAHIGQAVTDALMRLQLRHEIPVIHEVLLLENEQQARVRCLGKKHNRGAEAAETALAMAEVIALL
jgi:6,7-dimethyl-8-ribityllumazine synthase